MTMYERRPTRWRDVPRQRADVFLPRLFDVDTGPAIDALQAGYRGLPPGSDERAEDVMFGILLDVFRSRQTAGVGIAALNPTVREALARPDTLVCRLLDYAPDYPGYTVDDILGYAHPVPELEALMRHARVLHDQFRWDREQAQLVSVKDLADDDDVVVLHPRDADVARFIRRVRGGPRRLRSTPRARCRRGRRWRRVRPSTFVRASRSCRGWKRSPCARASAPAPTKTSSATPPTAGHR